MEKKEATPALGPPSYEFVDGVALAAPGNSRAMNLKAVFSYLQSRAKRENLISNGSLG